VENFLPERQTGELVKGRNSAPLSRYFVTCRSAKPTLLSIADQLNRALDTLQQDHDANIHCFSIMPDHVHLLLELGERLTLSQLVGKFKACSSRQMKKGDMTLKWQRNYFEHHLRPNEMMNPYARYIFMNPYRAGLIQRTKSWPFWRCGQGLQFDFQHGLVSGAFPPEEWFEEKDDVLFPADN
jgi:REP element-mobilizing transposase RayT